MWAPRLARAAAVSGLFMSSFAMASQVEQPQNMTDLVAVMEEVSSSVPDCAFACMMEVIPPSACSIADFDCVCSNQDVVATMTVCLQTSCSVREQLATQKFQTSACGIEGRDISHYVESIIWSLYSIAALFVLGRLAGRHPIMSLISWDDVTMTVCLLALSAASAIAHIMVKSGMGRDIFLLTPEQITDVLFYFFVQQYLYTFLVVFTKISILLLYLRLFPSKMFRYTCFSVIGMVVVFGLSCVFTTSFACRPVQYNWLMWDLEHQGTCFDVSKQAYGLAGVNMSLDIIIFVLPIYPLWQLQMNCRRRIAIIFMFIVGFFVTLCSILRLHSIAVWGDSLNATYDYTNLAVWSLIEMDVGVICACMPGVASLFKRMFPRFFKSTSSSSSPSNGLGKGNTPNSGSGGRRQVFRTFGGSSFVTASGGRGSADGGTVVREMRDAKNGYDDGSYFEDDNSDPYRVRSPHRLIAKTTDISVSYHQYVSSSTSSSPTSGPGETRRGSQDDEVELVERTYTRSPPLPPQLPPVYQLGGGNGVDGSGRMGGGGGMGGGRHNGRNDAYRWGADGGSYRGRW